MDISAFKEFLETASESDLIKLVPSLSALIKRCGTEHWWIKPALFASFEREGLHVTQNHFYSALPDVSSLGDALFNSSYYQAASFADGLETWKEIAEFAGELEDIPDDAPSGYYWGNSFFPMLDALVYYGLIRRYKPERLIEIGSGFSTHIALRAVDKNGAGEVQVIEPYPSLKLQEIADRIRLYRDKVQNVPESFFDNLRQGDFLFVDSSHVSKIGSDLNHILFRVVPRLPEGVFIHFHDIFLPFEYPKEWIESRNWFWNEQYLLLAFLMSNCEFKVLMPNHAFAHYHPDLVRNAFKRRCSPSGASFWIRKFDGKRKSNFLASWLTKKKRTSLAEISQGHALRQERPWKKVDLPEPVRSVSTMLSEEERALLYHLGRDVWRGDGQIVDAGCFLGGSTLALAHGLRARNQQPKGRPIHVYDLFKADDYMIQFYLNHNDPRLKVGDSVRSIFDANTEAIHDLLIINEGDIVQIGWPEEPIEIFFIDVAKSWSINDFLLERFFPYLIPGKSIVIQQDYVYENTYWLPITMELFEPYFEFVAYVPENSAVYRLRRPLPRELQRAGVVSKLPSEKKLFLMDRAVTRWHGAERGMLECAKARLLHELSGPEAAMCHVRAVKKDFGVFPKVAAAAKSVESLITSQN